MYGNLCVCVFIEGFLTSNGWFLNKKHLEYWKMKFFLVQALD